MSLKLKFVIFVGFVFLFAHTITRPASAATVIVKATDGAGKTFSGVSFQCTEGPNAEATVAGEKAKHTTVTTGAGGTATWTFEVRNNFEYACFPKSSPPCYYPKQGGSKIPISTNETVTHERVFIYEARYCTGSATIKPSSTPTASPEASTEPTPETTTIPELGDNSEVDQPKGFFATIIDAIRRFLDWIVSLFKRD